MTTRTIERFVRPVKVVPHGDGTIVGVCPWVYIDPHLNNKRNNFGKMIDDSMLEIYLKRNSTWNIISRVKSYMIGFDLFELNR